jgi:hypothetical protein
VQLTKPVDNSKPLDKKDILQLQQITGKFLYYSQAVNPTMNVTLSTLASQQTKGTEQSKKDAAKFLNYCGTHPEATLQYHALDMILKIHSNASYNSDLGPAADLEDISILAVTTQMMTPTKAPFSPPLPSCKLSYPLHQKPKSELSTRIPRHQPFSM